METLKLALKLKAAYDLNSFMYRLRRLPIIKKFFKNSSYAATDIKFIWLVFSTFRRIMMSLFFTALYYAGIGVASVIRNAEGTETPFDALGTAGPVDVTFFVLLSLVGALLNNYLVSTDYETYYAIRLLKFDAREYILTDYFLTNVKRFIFSFPCALAVTLIFRLPLWFILVMPLFPAAIKIVFTPIRLGLFDKKRYAGGLPVRNPAAFVIFAAIGLGAALTFITGNTTPPVIVGLLMLLIEIAAVPCVLRMLRYSNYLVYFKRFTATSEENAKKLTDGVNKVKADRIDEKTALKTSSKSGFAYFNDLFNIRHHKLLTDTTKIITIIIAVGFIAVTGFCLYVPDVEMMERFNGVLARILPVLPFIFYCINRGQQYSESLFSNCDRAMLHYAFYRKPRNILKLFALRLTSIAKQNMPPALVTGAGLVILKLALLFKTNGPGFLAKADPLELLLFVVAPLATSVFFSVHYLMLYYLLQPYDIESKAKGIPYRIATFFTYLACYMSYTVLSTLDTLNPIIYGSILIAFCVVYSGIACLLVYRKAPKTFKNRA